MISAVDQSLWTEKVRAGLNESGASPDQARRDQVEYVSFYDHFRRQNEKLLERQKSLWRSYYMTWLRSALYYDGKQVLVPRGNGFGYDIRQLRGTDQPIYVYNKLRPYSDKVTSMWVQSSPEILFAVLDPDERKAEKAIDEIQTINRYFNHLHLTEETLQEIAKGGQYCGNYHFEVWFDPNDKNGLEWVEEYQSGQMPGSMWYECLDCQQMGEMTGPACPHCGSQMITPHMMPAVDFDRQTSAEWKPAGEIVVRPFPGWSLRYSLTTGADNSPWRYAEEDQPKEVVEAAFGKIEQTGDVEALGVDESMHPERVMRRADRGRMGWEAEDDTDNVLTQRFWYEPEMLALLALKEDCRLPDGETIPRGERLSDVFPDGMCIFTHPGAPRFKGVTRESHLKRFVDGRYGITLGKKVGHGIEDGVELQRQTNILKSGVFRYLQKTLQPSIAVNNRVFQDSRLFNRVDNVISINNGRLPEGTRVGDHFAYVTPPAVNPQIFGVEQALSADMQAALKAFNSSGDYAGVENNTATAAKIGAAESASAHSLYLALYAGVLKNLAVRRLELAQEHYQNLRLVAYVDTLSDKRNVRIVNSINVKTNILAWVKTGSFMPNLDMERRAAFIEATTAATTLAGINMLNPASLQTINRIFNVDLTFERLNERQEQCEEALDLMIEAFEQSGGMITPDVLYMLSPVDPYTKGHEAKIEWWRDWLGSREGRNAPEQVRQAVVFQIEAEYAALIQEQQYIAAAANAGQALIQAQSGAINAMSEPGKPGDDADTAAVENPMAADPTMAVNPNSMRTV